MLSLPTLNLMIIFDNCRWSGQRWIWGPSLIIAGGQPNVSWRFVTSEFAIKQKLADALLLLSLKKLADALDYPHCRTVNVPAGLFYRMETPRRGTLHRQLLRYARARPPNSQEYRTNGKGRMGLALVLGPCSSFVLRENSAEKAGGCVLAGWSAAAARLRRRSRSLTTTARDRGAARGGQPRSAACSPALLRPGRARRPAPQRSILACGSRRRPRRRGQGKRKGEGEERKKREIGGDRWGEGESEREGDGAWHMGPII
jgi:hypothetical protein